MKLAITKKSSKHYINNLIQDVHHTYYKSIKASYSSNTICIDIQNQALEHIDYIMISNAINYPLLIHVFNLFIRTCDKALNKM